MSKRVSSTSIEVIILDDDPWANFGSPLPPEPHSLSADSHAQVIGWSLINSSYDRRASKRLGRWALPAALTLILHALLVESLLLGTPARKSHPPLTEGAAASAQNANAREFVSTLIFVNDRSITDPNTRDESAYDVITNVLTKKVDQATQLAATLAELASVSQPEVWGSETGKDENAPTAEATGDDAGRAKLFGLYMGQVKARIERAWDQPAAPLNGKFQCKVEVAQGEHGEVKEVTLQRCNGSPAWQVSLVQAIQRASPLPAPPSEKVFTAVLTLNFDAVSTANLVSNADHK